MTNSRRPFLLYIVLLAIGLRTVLGAPCCMTPLQAAEMPSAHAQMSQSHAEHAIHADHAGHTEHAAKQDAPDHGDHSDHGDRSGHGGHGDDATAKPCCSACGPTLPPELAQLTPPAAVHDVPVPAAIRALETRPPFPAYDATGPPLLI